MQVYEKQSGAYLFSTDKGLLHIPFIHHYLSQESYWAMGIPVELVRKSIANSLCFGIYTNNLQVGFARVVSDYSTFAYLADVFVDEAHRGMGLSKQLIQFIMNHPELKGLRRFCLGTRDAHGLYTQFNFKRIAQPENWMEIKHADIYIKPEQG